MKKPKFIVKAISDHDIMDCVKYLKIPHFKGVFSRNTLHVFPKDGEVMVLNLDHSSSDGAHWVAWYVSRNQR